MSYSLSLNCRGRRRRSEFWRWIWWCSGLRGLVEGGERGHSLRARGVVRPAEVSPPVRLRQLAAHPPSPSSFYRRHPFSSRSAQLAINQSPPTWTLLDEPEPLPAGQSPPLPPSPFSPSRTTRLSVCYLTVAAVSTGHCPPSTEGGVMIGFFRGLENRLYDRFRTGTNACKDQLAD